MGTGYLLHFSPFLHQFLLHPSQSKIETFLHFQQPKENKEQYTENEKTISKDDPNQLSINEINALQAEQSN